MSEGNHCNNYYAIPSFIDCNIIIDKKQTADSDTEIHYGVDEQDLVISRPNSSLIESIDRIEEKGMSIYCADGQTRPSYRPICG